MAWSIQEAPGIRCSGGDDVETGGHRSVHPGELHSWACKNRRSRRGELIPALIGDEEPAPCEFCAVAREPGDTSVNQDAVS
jgi:hypothetical protein